jgi:hypothetical protein
MLGFADLKPDCLLKVSLYPEGPVTGQLDQVFPWQMLGWYPNSMLHCMLPMQPSQWYHYKFRPDFSL